jgi:hypothetical protein
MTSKNCTICELDLPASKFGKDGRTRSGLKSACTKCANIRRAQTKRCKKCMRCYRSDGMSRHKCKGSRLWEKYSSKGTDKIKCPCKHPKCKKMIIEATVYKHLKYGDQYWDAQEKETSKRQSKLVKCIKCKEMIRCDWIRRHRCDGVKVKKPWNDYKSGSSVKMICPCGHKKCTKNLSEGTIYNHLRMGQKYWDDQARRTLLDPRNGKLHIRYMPSYFN